MADDESHEAHGEQQGDENEAKKAMEEAKRLRLEKQKQELEEYEEMRREAREKEKQEIEELRLRREQRRAEREAEEVRLTELRAQEEARRKAEEEVRRRKKVEEEARIKEEKERKKREAEERLKKAKKPNFVITKRSDSEKGPGSDRGVLEPLNADDMQKSKEQLEEEKQAILAQRITPLTIEGMASDKLLGKAKDLVDAIRRLEGDRYDLEQRYKRQQYDMIELAERARQMNKGKGKRGLASAQVDESFDRLADKFSSAPPKIQLCSKYERHTDHRTYTERAKLFQELDVEDAPSETTKKEEGGEGGEEVEAE